VAVVDLACNAPSRFGFQRSPSLFAQRLPAGRARDKTGDL